MGVPPTVQLFQGFFRKVEFQKNTTKKNRHLCVSQNSGPLKIHSNLFYWPKNTSSLLCQNFGGSRDFLQITRPGKPKYHLMKHNKKKHTGFSEVKSSRILELQSQVLDISRQSQVLQQTWLRQSVDSQGPVQKAIFILSDLRGTGSNPTVKIEPIFWAPKAWAEMFQRLVPGVRNNRSLPFLKVLVNGRFFQNLLRP